MKKILVSVVMIGLVALIGVAATRAFFSDTETSTGNVFTAGAIDLKVDSTAHYNGLTCIDGTWQNVCLPDGNNLLVNGGFETPVVANSAKWDIYPNGTSGMGWIVEWESTQTEFGGRTRPTPALQEYHKGVNGWVPAEGNQYAELDSDWFGPSDSLNNEPALVKIYQNITTEVGKKYHLSYHFSPRPGTGSGDNILTVKVNGTALATQNGSGSSNTTWTFYEHEFTADATTTRIEFVGGGTANSLGVFLDGVSLRLMTCPSTFVEMEGDSCDGSWELTDLGPSHKFFNLSDIKPGDWGENTISLHVIDNPAYACLRFTNVHDDDPELTEPESNPEEGGDTTPGPDNGELGDNIMMFMWHDDGDNIWEKGEHKLLTEGPLPASYVMSRSWGIAEPWNGEILPLQTRYIGFAWCAGEMTAENYVLTCNGTAMGNVAQKDTLTADVVLYVEQSRNNDSFSCSANRINDSVTF